jgi:TRAP-type mannitol/chloroaromatic compound transport system permease large subunit
MSEPALGLLMLSLIVVVIMMGFPTAFTLMGLGIFFGLSITSFIPPAGSGGRTASSIMVQRTTAR